MSIAQIKEIANAVLYEGYLLYPYRHSSIKNRQRWTFGVVYPQEYSQANGGIEPWAMQTECLVAGQEDSATELDVYIRFLHLLVRKTARFEPRPVRTDLSCPPSRVQQGWPDTINRSVQDTFSFATTRESGMASYQVPETWEEGVEQEVSALHLSLRDLVAQPQTLQIAFPGGYLPEEETTSVAGVTTYTRQQQALAGVVIISAEVVGPQLFKLTIRIENRTPDTANVTNRHDAVIQQSFVSTHTILQVQQGAFISLMNPPAELQAVAQQCQNVRTWPVLVGEDGTSDAMLSSPIILYDYPQIAPESAGALFDGTEIDEILMLRIMTLSDEEKEEIRQGDERAREILERTESITQEQFMKLHGTIRSLRPVDEANTLTRGE